MAPEYLRREIDLLSFRRPASDAKTVAKGDPFGALVVQEPNDALTGGSARSRKPLELHRFQPARPEGIEPPALGFEVLDHTSQGVAGDSKPLQIQQVAEDDISRGSPKIAANSPPFGPLVVQSNRVGPADPPDVGPFLTVREVAEKLRVCTATVYDICDSGQLAHVRVTNAIRVSAEALRRYLRTRVKRGSTGGRPRCSRTATA